MLSSKRELLYFVLGIREFMQCMDSRLRGNDVVKKPGHVPVFYFQ
jgi:hypothetical protein